jgi:hypothetical protein
MLRQFLGALAVLTALIPDRIVDVFEASRSRTLKKTPSIRGLVP